MQNRYLEITSQMLWHMGHVLRLGRRKEVGGGFRREGTQVGLWPIHVDVWQNPLQYCKVITLQLKFKRMDENKRLGR